MEEKKRVVPGETCTIGSERSNHCRKTVLNAQEVSRGHSSGAVVKDRINRSLKYDPERRNVHMNAENK